MSFKSKQRAKHGHLFGDDPLNATLVSASDDPLFAPKKTSQSSRTNSPVASDPLLRSSRPASPLDTSSSTPISARRTTNAKTNGSIFGDIDVSKLGGGGGSSSNGSGLYSNGNNNKRVSTTSLRSTTTLRSSRQFDEDEEDLFGGGRVSRTRVLSKTTSPTLSTASNTSTSKKNTPSNIQSSPKSSTESPPRQTTPTPSPPLPTITKPSVPAVAALPTEEINPVVEEKPSSSFFASASRFFKSSSNTYSKASSSASSVASANSSSVQQEETMLPSSRQPPQQIQQQIQQRKSQFEKQQSKHIPPITQPRIIDDHQEEEDDKQKHIIHHVIEDEATRAFADDVITFKPAEYQPDYAAISPDLPMDSLRLDTPNKKLLPSASTPTTSQADVDDPWFDGSAITNSTISTLMNNNNHDTTKLIPILGHIEPSVSTPLHRHKVSVQDIEPQKRTAFADLIASWNTGQTNNNIYETVHKEDPEQFFSHVAEEQRDIGFAGIAGEEDEDEFVHRRTRTILAVDVWDSSEENPWN